MNHRKGASAIEFALWLPVMMTILSGSLDVGWCLWSKQLAVNAAREGARASSRVTRDLTQNLPPDADDIETTGETQARNVLIAQGTGCGTDCIVTATWFTDTISGFEFVTVSVEYPFDPLIGFIPALFDTIHADFTAMTLNQV